MSMELFREIAGHIKQKYTGMIRKVVQLQDGAVPVRGFNMHLDARASGRSMRVVHALM